MLKAILVLLALTVALGWYGFAGAAAVAGGMARFLFFIALGSLIVVAILSIGDRDRVGRDPFL